MSLTNTIVRSELIAKGWFCSPGAYVLVDGQFGSTGKGLLACLFADVSVFGPRITHVTSNQGPNSGHTGYVPQPGGEARKVMVQQLPVASVVMGWLSGYVDGFPQPTCYLNAGAVIDPLILGREMHEHATGCNLVVHPCAAVIQPEDTYVEAHGPIAAVASTGKGVGSAIARKVTRQNNVAGYHAGRPAFLPKEQVRELFWNWNHDRVLVEVPQGFSLGINSPLFHPHTTSRECTVMQAIADARIPTKRVRKVAACYRTFPIRVGNTNQGYSGDCYPDQRELTWEEVGQPAEQTSVTKRERRVFSWSRTQFRESVKVNEPDLIFLNFMNYLSEDKRNEFCEMVVDDYENVLGRLPETVLLGMGPKNGDVSVWRF